MSMNCVHLFQYMNNFTKIFFFKASLLTFIFLNSCAVNNKMMIGSEVAEIALPLSFDSQKRKIQNNPNNQLGLF